VLDATSRTFDWTRLDQLKISIAILAIRVHDCDDIAASIICMDEFDVGTETYALNIVCVKDGGIASR
jgi:hypothetical protein